MDPSIIINIVLAAISFGLPFLLSTVKNPASKAKLKSASPEIRAAGLSLIKLADAIDATAVKRKRVR